MPISKPTLPPRKGYVEVEIDGVRQYAPITSEVTGPIEPIKSDIDLMAEAYVSGVNEA